MVAAGFVEELRAQSTEKDREANLRFAPTGEDSEVLGVRHKLIFDLARKFAGMALDEVEKLLDSRYYEVRLGAVAIMDFQAQRKNLTDVARERLCELYLNRHDRINNWDLVDRAAKRVVGGYLHAANKPRGMLASLARSKDVWERRTAIVATSFFIGKGELEDTFHIAEILVNDPHDLIQKAVGGWIREAGKRNQKMLTDFLDKHARTMPRTMLRNAIEKLSPSLRQVYLASDKG